MMITEALRVYGNCNVHDLKLRGSNFSAKTRPYKSYRENRMKDYIAAFLCYSIIDLLKHKKNPSDRESVYAALLRHAIRRRSLIFTGNCICDVT